MKMFAREKEKLILIKDSMIRIVEFSPKEDSDKTTK